MSKINDILNKSFQGKLATDPNLGAEQEPHASGSILDYAFYGGRFTRKPLGTARFAPSSPKHYAHQSIVQTTGIPRRFRRWSEPALVFGVDLFGEGDSVSISTASTLESNTGMNFSANFSRSSNFSVLSESFIMLHEKKNGSDVAYSNLKAHSVTSSVGTEITLTSTVEDLSDGGASYRWSHYGYLPPRLLPIPSSSGEVTTYAAILPEEWPVIDWRREQEDVVFGSALTKSDVTNVEIFNFTQEHLALEAPLGDLDTGDFILVHGRVFYVVNAIASGAFDFVEATPIHSFEVNGIAAETGLTIQTLYTVKELTEDPSLSAGTDAKGNVLPALYDAPFLDWIRVKNLMPPSSSGTNRSVLGAFVDNTSQDQIGFAPALIPSTPAGAAHSAKSGISSLSGITLDPGLETEQGVVVDHREGVFYLSDAISPGSVLNPDSFTDAQGYPRLYAVFATYNGPTTPLSVQRLDQVSEQASIEALPLREDSASGASSLKGWKVTMGGNIRSGYYFYPENELSIANPPVEFGGRAEAFYFVEGNDAHEGGPMMVFEKRSELDGAMMVGAIAYNGRGGFSPEYTSSISFIPDVGDGQEELTSSNRPELRVSTTKAITRISSTEFFTISPGDVLEGTVNGVDFSIALLDDSTDDSANPNGLSVQAPDGQRSISEIISDIVIKMPPGVLARGRDYDLRYYFDGSDFIWVFEASGSLKITTDDANLFPSSDAAPTDISLSFAYNRTVEASLRFLQRERELWYDGKGIRVDEVKLGTPVASSFVNEGFDVIETSLQFGQPFAYLKSGSFITPEGPVSIKTQTQVALTADRRIGVYYRVSSGTINTVQQVATSPFLTINREDIPLYIFEVDVSGAVSYTVDVRDFITETESQYAITVGTKGRVRSLSGAIELAKSLASTQKAHPVISLLEDVDYDMENSNKGSYSPIQATPYLGAPNSLPSNLTIQGNGHTVLVSGVPDETSGAGEPLFFSDGGSFLKFENINFTRDVSLSYPSVSLMAGNFDNDGTVIFENVTLQCSEAGKDFHLYGATNVIDSLQEDVVIRNLTIQGGIRLRNVSRFICEDVRVIGVDGEDQTISMIVSPSSHVRVNNIMSAITPTSPAMFGFFEMKDYGHLKVSGFKGSSLRVQPQSGSSVIGAKVDLDHLDLKSDLTLGSSSVTMEGSFTVDHLKVSSTSGFNALSIQQTSKVRLSKADVTSAAARTVNIIDSDVHLSEVVVVNTSAAVGPTTKVGMYLEGSNGSVVGSANAMDSDVVIENCNFRVDSGSGIYIHRANEDGKRTIIRNNLFENEDNNTSSRGVCLGSDISVGAENIDHVYITHNVFDTYTVSGTNYAVGPPSSGSNANQGLLIISFNHARGFSAGATEFFNLSSATSRVVSNGFTI